MSGLFDDDDVAAGRPVHQPTVVPVRAADEVGLMSDEAKAELRAAREKAKKTARAKAKQASQMAAHVAQKAQSNWLPKAEAWWAAERAKGVRKGVWIFGACMALLTGGASAGIWWHAQPHMVPPAQPGSVVAQKDAAPAPSELAGSKSHEVAVLPTAIAKALIAEAPAAVTEAPKRAPPVVASAKLKPLPFNPQSPEFKQGQAKPKAVPKKLTTKPTKSAWEHEQETKLDAFFKH